jgi:hypothetical protein
MPSSLALFLFLIIGRPAQASSKTNTRGRGQASVPSCHNAAASTMSFWIHSSSHSRLSCFSYS